MVDHTHNWETTGKVAVHAYGPPVTYVRCTICGQSGFRNKGGKSKIVYTWRDNGDLEITKDG